MVERKRRDLPSQLPTQRHRPARRRLCYAHLLLARELGVGEHAAELEEVMNALALRMTEAQRAEAASRARGLRSGIGP